MKKRIVSLLLTLVLLAALLPQTALTTHAASSGACGENLTWTFDGDTGELAILGTGRMYYWEDPDEVPWYNFKSEIKTVSLPEGLNSIGYHAFSGCASLKTINLPDTVTQIGEYAFSNCKNLTKAIIPSSVTNIEEAAFSGSGLKTLSIPATVKNCGERICYSCENMTTLTIRNAYCGAEAFMNCSALKTVKISGGLTRVEENMFRNCTTLTEVSLPDTTKRIESGAFEGCVNLKTVKIPYGCAFHQANPFRRCTSLTSLYLPASVTEIPGIFLDCVSLAEIMIVDPKCTIPQNKYALGTPGKTTIYGLSGSTAEKYAIKYGYTFKSGDCLAPPVIKVKNDAATGRVKVTWKAVPGAVGYEVYRSINEGGNYSLIGESDHTEFIDDSLGMTWGASYYYYQVRAIAEEPIKNSGLSGADSGCRIFPCPVVTLKLENGGEENKSYIVLTWKKIEHAQAYEVYRAESKNGTYHSIGYVTESTISIPDIDSEKERHYTDSADGKLGQTFYYKVVARDNYGHDSMYSAVKSIRFRLAPPEVTATNMATTGKIKLTWKPIDGAVSYKVYRAESKDGPIKLMKTVTSGTSYINIGAVAGQKYWYKVKAIHANTSANSAYSSAKSRTCDLPRPVVSITRTAAGKPKLTWKKVAGAVSYKVYRCETKTGTYKLMKTVTDGLSYTNTSAEKGKTYYYKVKAVHKNAEALSAFSLVKSITAK